MQSVPAHMLDNISYHLHLLPASLTETRWGFSISLSLYNTLALPPALPLLLQAVSAGQTGHQGLAEVTKTVTEVPPATVGERKTLQTQ